MTTSAPGRTRLRAAVTAWLSLAHLVLAAAAGATQASAQSDVQHARGSPQIDALIAEAALRFDVPTDWIRAVMRQESAFDPAATSHAGAMGLMQVMPGTYAELRRRYGLGTDPYEPRDNVMAGAAYLRELHDRFGPEGMLAAYNAGPGRYLQHRDQGRPLPAETRTYMARIGALIGSSSPSNAAHALVSHLPDPAGAPLFPSLSADDASASSGLFPTSFSGARPEEADHE